jgi:hypothetical protein
MRKILTLICLFSLMLGCASARRSLEVDNYNLPPGSIVLRVEVIDVQFTDLYPNCDEGENCMPFYFWWKYRARIKEVISGTWSQPMVEFTHLQHAEYIRKVTKDCYVVLRPAGEELRSKVGVPFVADRLLSRFFNGHRSAIKALRNGA